MCVGVCVCVGVCGCVHALLSFNIFFITETCTDMEFFELVKSGLFVCLFVCLLFLFMLYH